MSNKNIKIVELPASVLSQISGGADKAEPKSDDTTLKKIEDNFKNPAFWAIWGLD